MMSFEYTCTCIKVLYHEKRSELSTHRPSLKGYINLESRSLLLSLLYLSPNTHRLYIAYCRYYIILYQYCIISISIAVLYLPTRITCRFHNPYSFVEVSPSRPFSSSSFFSSSFSHSFFSFFFFRSSISSSHVEHPTTLLLQQRNIFSRFLISFLTTFSS